MNTLKQKLLIDFRALHLSKVFSWMLVFGLAYGFFILFEDETGVPLTRMIDRALHEPGQLQHLFNWQQSPYFKFILLCLIIVLLLYLAFFAYFSYQATLKKLDTAGQKKFQAILLSHGLTNLFDLLLTPVAVLLSGALFFALTGQYLTLEDATHTLSQAVERFFEAVPRWVELPFPLSFLAAILATDLVTYLKHRLVHESRFLWFVVHRVHHSPETMHVMGTGPVYGFDFLLKTPTILLTLVLTKVFAGEPLFIETIVYYSLGLLIGQLSHTTAFYHFAYHNKIVYAISHFLGTGVFHYTHHSAVPGEEVNNLSGSIFMFWDRVFGTYLKPRPEAPPVGLTSQPEIVLNPLMLYFSGARKIVYELKNNAPKYWLKIVFGSVHFTPPVTKDDLILGYPKNAP